MPIKRLRSQELVWAEGYQIFNLMKQQTQLFMGRGQLVDRLTKHVGSREMAVDLLIKRGHLESDGKTFTKAGAMRNSMTAGERAIDRESKRLNKSKSDFSYNPKTNTAKIKSNGAIK